jgi:hypothetical protein
MLSACTESMDTLSANAESIILSAPPAECLMLSVLFGLVIMLTAAATQKTTNCNTDDCQLTTLVNSASTVPPIGLLSKGAGFCHPSNILLVGHWRRRALWRLYFNSSVSVIGQTVGSQYWLPGFRRFPSKRISA